MTTRETKGRIRWLVFGVGLIAVFYANRNSPFFEKVSLRLLTPAVAEEGADEALETTTEATSESESPNQTGGNQAADYRKEAVRLSHKIQHVTVFSDKAEIQRSANLKLNPGYQWIEFSSLPMELDRNSVKLRPSAANASISQIVMEESFEHTMLAANVKEQMKTLRAYYSDLLVIGNQKRSVERSRKLIEGISYLSPFKATATQDFLGFSVSQESIRSSLFELNDQTSYVQLELNHLSDRINELHEKIRFLQDEIRNATELAEQKWFLHVYCLVYSKDATSGTLELNYLVPNAVWRPVYDLRAKLNHESASAEIQLVTGGFVEQHTGENWNDVKLTLSTVDPAPLFMPKLEKWVFAEKRMQTVGTLKRSEGAMEKKAPQKVSMDSMLARNSPPASAAVAESYQDFSEADQKTETLSKSKSGMLSAFGGGAKENSQSSPKALSAGKADGPVSRAKKMALAEPPSKDRSDLESANITSAPFPMNSIESLFPEFLAIDRSISSIEKGLNNQYRTLDSENPGKAEPDRELTDATLPSVQAHGRKIEFTSPFSVSIKSNEEPYKMPVNSDRLNAKLKYYAVPKNDPRVFLRAELTNTLSRPILGGQAQIFMDGDLVSKTNLNSLSEGGFLNVDLGTDQNVETKRIVTKSSQEKGLIFSKHETDVTVKIELANHHPFAIQMEVLDNYPQSPNEKIEINLGPTSPKPATDDKGVLKWLVTVPANQKSKIEFKYKVAHPENFLVSEFN